jgi:translation initiation factor 3 subunit D
MLKYYNSMKIILGNNIKLVARCEHDAVAAGTNNEMLYLTTKALNEWDSRYFYCSI